MILVLTFVWLRVSCLGCLPSFFGCNFLSPFCLYFADVVTVLGSGDYLIIVYSFVTFWSGWRLAVDLRTRYVVLFGTRPRTVLVGMNASYFISLFDFCRLVDLCSSMLRFDICQSTVRRARCQLDVQGWTQILHPRVEVERASMNVMDGHV